MKNLVPSTSVDLNALEVGDEDSHYILHIYEMNRTRPTASFGGVYVKELRQIAADIVLDGGLWVDLVFYPMHLLGRFVIERVDEEPLFDEW